MCVYNGFDVFNHYSNAVTQVCKIKLYFFNKQNFSFFFLKKTCFFNERARKYQKTLQIPNKNFALHYC